MDQEIIMTDENGAYELHYALVDLMAAYWFQRYRLGKDSKKTYMEHINAMIQGHERKK